MAIPLRIATLSLKVRAGSGLRGRVRRRGVGGGRCGGRWWGPRRCSGAVAGAGRRRCRSRSAGRPGPPARSVVSSSSRAWSVRCCSSQRAGLRPVSSRNRRVNVRTLMLAWPASSRRVSGSCSRCWAQCRVGAVLASVAPGHRPLDVLRLTAVAPRRHHAAAGRPVGHLAAVVGADDVQAEVDAGGHPGRGEHVAVVDEEHVGVESHVRVPAPEPFRVRPVGGRRPPVEQAGGGEHEGAGADRHDPGAPVVRRAQRRCTAGSSTPSVSAGPSWMPGTITVSACSSSSSSWSGSTRKPAVLRTGRPPGVHASIV